MEGDTVCDAEQFELLRQAREKGERLLAEMLKVQAEAEWNPNNLPLEQFEQGRHAMANAIASTRRMLASLDAATKIAAVDNN